MKNICHLSQGHSLILQIVLGYLTLHWRLWRQPLSLVDCWDGGPGTGDSSKKLPRIPFLPVPFFLLTALRAGLTGCFWLL